MYSTNSLFVIPMQVTINVYHVRLLRSRGDSDLSHVTSVGEVVIARAHVTVLPRLRDAETRRVAGGWCVVQLSLKFVCTGVTPCVEVKIQLIGVKFVYVINHIERQAGTSFGFERTASFLYPAHVCSVRT